MGWRGQETARTLKESDLSLGRSGMKEPEEAAFVEAERSALSKKVSKGG
jgi:hypothetical protein